MVDTVDFNQIFDIQRVLFTRSSADFNVTTDQALTKAFAFSEYRITLIRITNPSISLTTAVGGFYTATGKGGIAVVSNSQVYSQLTGAARGLNATVSADGLGKLTAAALYLSLTTPQGAAATADIEVIGWAKT